MFKFVYKYIVLLDDFILCYLEVSCNTSSSFACATNKTCITSADLCNNITDCANGEDENDIICGHFCEWPSLSTCTSKKIFI